jgi:pimeloyl-ACP methyl ester carboxylesterase
MIHHPGLRVVALGALFATSLLAACGGSDTSPAGPDVDGRSKLVFIACAVPIADTTVLCGTLTVPEDRAKSDSRLLGLPFFLLPALSPAKASDPVAFFLGGPGPVVPLLAIASAEDLQVPLRRNRDTILVNYRGFEGTQPASLDCPELATPTGGFSSQAEALAATRACRGRLEAAGVDISAYTTKAVARDMEDLRILLGRERGFLQWNVVGSSYGTRVAQAYARDFPKGVRSMSLDGSSPLDSPVNATVAAGALETADAFVSLCSAQPACASAFPNLKSDFGAALVRLETQPATFDGVSVGVNEVLGLLTAAVPGDSSGVPLFMQRVARGDIAGARLAIVNTFDAALPILAARRPYSPVPLGANSALICHDDLSLAEEAGALTSVAAAWPEAVGRAVLTASTLAFEQAQCSVWVEGAVAMDPTQRVVRGDMPVLTTVGQFDNATPPSLTARLGARFSANRTVILANRGHALLESIDPCAFALHVAFIDAPTTPLDTACANSDGDLVFKTSTLATSGVRL